MKEPFFEIKSDSGKTDVETRPEIRARGLVESFDDRHRRYWEWYAGDSSIEIVSAEGVDTPDGPLNTCAIDLEHGKVYLHPRFLSEIYGGTEAKMLFGASHEFEHFRKLRSLLREKDGARIWQRHQERVRGKRRLHILDNSFADVQMNRTVVGRAPALAGTRREMYLKDLFPDRDLTSLPKHLQFAHILNCENQDTGEEWQVAPDVREAMQRLRTMKGKSGVQFIDYASRPDTPMSVRLDLQEQVIEPIYEQFFEEDFKQREADKKPGGKGQKSPKKKGGKKFASGRDGESSDAEEAPENPEDYFREEYEAILKRYRHATPEEVIDREVEEEIKRQSAASGNNTGAKAFEAYARAQEVSPEDLREYQRFRENIEDILNPETGERLVKELRELFQRIITRRKKPMLQPQYPLPEGDSLDFPAEAVARTHAGEIEPDVWGDVEFKEREDRLVGDFDVTIVGDASKSMKEKEGKKYLAQRQAVASMLEPLAEFSADLEERRTELAHDLHVRTEGWVFGDGAECIKPLSEELTEKERVAMYRRLGNPNGSYTRDFLVLEKLLANLSDEEREKILSGTLKKIVIVLTDGESNGDERGNAIGRVQEVTAKLRQSGVIVIGIGVTADGRSALTTYAPEARLCERVEDLVSVLAELLKEHLQDLSM